MSFIRYFLNAALMLLFLYSPLSNAAEDIRPNMSRSSEDVTEVPTTHVTSSYCEGRTDGSYLAKSGYTYVCKGGRTAKKISPEGTYETCVGYGCGASTGVSTDGGTGDGSSISVGNGSGLVGVTGSETGSGAGGGSGSDIGNGRGGGSVVDPSSSGSQTGGGGSTTSTGGSQTDRSCGKMVNGQWVEQDCNKPVTPQPEAPPQPETPTSPAIPPHIARKYQQRIDELRDTYLNILKNLEKQLDTHHDNHVHRVIRCEKDNAGHSASSKKALQNCIDSSKKLYDKRVEEIKTAIEETKQRFNEALGNIKEAMADEVAASAGSLPSANFGDQANANAPGDANSANNSGQSGGDTTVNNTTVNNSSNTTNVNNGGGTGGNGGKSDSPGNGVQGESIEFEDLNDVEEYCKTNPRSMICMQLPEKDVEDPDVDEWATGITDLLKQNGSQMPDFRLDRFLNSGSRAQCPQPLTFSVWKYNASMSFDSFCIFLNSIRPFVVICFIISTTLFVLSGVKK